VRSDIEITVREEMEDEWKLNKLRIRSSKLQNKVIVLGSAVYEQLDSGGVVTRSLNLLA
jgi:hypothetical protein